MLTGSLVALITPMFEDGSIDYASYKKLIEFHLDAGSDAIVTVGTTGESATVSVEEHIEIISRTVEYVNGRIPVIAGTGGNCTEEAITLSKKAKEVGASYGLSVVPYYNRPSQEGLYQHFKAIAQSTDLPIILYNVPTRTAIDLHDETVLRLTDLPNIVGLKDATGNLQRAAHLTKYAPEGFALYSGDDGSALAFLLQGGHGVISVTANLAPKAMHDLCVAALAGNIALARSINDKLQSLHRDLFIESSPTPVKWAAQAMGLIRHSHVRLPLSPLTAESEPRVRKALLEAEINI
jgi:4-hydroxy-tetrahydrodipicolinate synthase